MSAVPTGSGRTLPDGWRWMSMGDIAEVVGGGTPRTTEPANFDGGDVPWITPADLSGYTEKYISHGSRFITRKGLESSAARLLPAGTILFSSRAPIGYVAIARNPIATNQGFKSFVLKDSVLPEYVYWWLKGSKQRAEKLASGTTFLEISGANAKKIPIPIAPIEQQRKIVSEIEKQFSRLDESVANLKRVAAKVGIYRNSVLSSICDGEAPRRPLGSLLRESLRNGHSAKAVVSGDGVPTFTLSAVTEGNFSDCNVKQTSANPDRVRDLWVKRGDIFVERSNTPELVGTARLYQGNDDRAIFPDLLIRVRVADSVLPEWAELCLLSPLLRRYFKSRAQGIAGSMPKIDQEVVSEALIPVPSVAIQKQLVGEAERRFSVAAELEAQACTALARASRLRYSILASAFSI